VSVPLAHSSCASKSWVVVSAAAVISQTLKTGFLPAEYVDVYGIPFSLIPFKGKTKESEGPDPVYTPIFAVPDRAAFEVRFPMVESYVYDLRGAGIQCDVSKMEVYDASAHYIPTAVWMTAIREFNRRKSGWMTGTPSSRRGTSSTRRFARSGSSSTRPAGVGGPGARREHEE